MTEAAAEARRAYRRKWARENRDKVRAQQARYWAKKAREQVVGAPECDSAHVEPEAGKEGADGT